MSPINVRAATVLLASGIVAALAPGAATHADPSSTNTVAWGWNALGQTGTGSNLDSHLVPAAVAGGHRFTKVATGQTHTVALSSDGTVWRWGDKDPIHYAPFLQENDPVPVQVPGLSGITAIAAGADVSLALRSDGVAFAWGANENGQLCDGTVENRMAPIAIALSGIAGVATSGHHSMLLRQDGTVWTCGANSQGELGDGTTTGRLSPVRVPGLSAAVEVAAGLQYSLVRRSDGSVWGWGTNENGELATGTFTPYRATAAALTGLSGITSISAGMSHALALTGAGQVKSWGENSTGQVCDGTKINRANPVPVLGLPAGAVVSQVSAGRFSLAIRIAGTVYTCGRNINGQLGDGTTNERLTAGVVPGLAGVQRVAVGGSHVVAILP
ncbi:MAG TPA: hypothetical protein VFC19_33365 [Candidatus Limnocylindrales bacterium]|nr:hypothetical protein [Candidatus Limnocylindrales bacterium]